MPGDPEPNLDRAVERRIEDHAHLLSRLAIVRGARGTLATLDDEARVKPEIDPGRAVPLEFQAYVLFEGSECRAKAEVDADRPAAVKVHRHAPIQYDPETE